MKLSTLGNAPITLIREDENAMMKNIMAQMGQSFSVSKPNVVLNITHPIISKLKSAKAEKVGQVATLLYGSCLMLEGKGVDNGLEFAKTLNELIESSL